MKNFKLVVAAFGIAAISASGVHAQNRKEIIQTLTRKTDSLEKALLGKTETIHKLEVQLAKLEGSTETQEQATRRAEIKADSLIATLLSKNTLIDNLNGQVSKLSKELDSLQSNREALTTEKEALQAELANFRQKKENEPVSHKENSPADRPKENETVPAIQTGNKSE